MAKKTFTEEFDIDTTVRKPVTIIKDYEIFKDKELLDQLRVQIIQNILDNQIPENTSLKDYINTEIDHSIEDYDLSNLEREHIFY